MGSFWEWPSPPLSELRAFAPKPPQIRGLYNLHFEIKDKETERRVNSLVKHIHLENDRHLSRTRFPGNQKEHLFCWSPRRVNDLLKFSRPWRGWNLNQEPHFSGWAQIMPFQDAENRLPLPNLLTAFKLPVNLPSIAVVSGISALFERE